MDLRLLFGLTQDFYGFMGLRVWGLRVYVGVKDFDLLFPRAPYHKYPRGSYIIGFQGFRG